MAVDLPRPVAPFDERGAYCESCGDWGIFVRQPSGGGWQVRFRCSSCNNYSRAIAHECFRDGVIETLDVHDPWGRLHQECAVCGRHGPTEGHHLAPRQNFGEEACRWPVVEVCRKCHERWHQRMGQSIGRRG